MAWRVRDTNSGWRRAVTLCLCVSVPSSSSAPEAESSEPAGQPRLACLCMCARTCVSVWVCLHMRAWGGVVSTGTHSRLCAALLLPRPPVRCCPRVPDSAGQRSGHRREDCHAPGTIWTFHTQQPPAEGLSSPRFMGGDGGTERVVTCPRMPLRPSVRCGSDGG